MAWLILTRHNAEIIQEGVDRLDNFSRRRAQLLAAKQVTQPIQQLGMPQSIKQRLEAEAAEKRKIEEEAQDVSEKIGQGM